METERRRRASRSRWIRIVVLSSIVLCAVGLDLFYVGQKRFMCQAHQAEARVNLRALWSLEKQFHDRTGTYSTNLKQIEFFPEANRRYAYGFSAAGEEGALSADDSIKPGRISDLPATTGATKDHFRAAAVGIPWTWADVPDVWVIDDTGSLSQVNDGCRWSMFHAFSDG